MADSPRHPLRDALSGVPGERLDPLQLVSAVVTAVAASGSSFTITARFPDGTTVPGIGYLGWWAPRVDDVVMLLQQGPALFALGSAGPANVYSTPAPAPPPPPTPPPPAPSIVTRHVQPVWMGSHKPSGAGWYENDIRQGGTNYTGLWFYGNRIAAAKGSGTIIGASIYVRRSRTSHGVGGLANVRLAVHNGSGPGAGYSIADTAVRAALAKGKDANVALSSAQIGRLNSGWTGLALAPGSPSYTSPDYLRADSGAPSGALALTIRT